MPIELLLKASCGFLNPWECICRCFELLVAKGAGRYAGNLTDVLDDPDSAFGHGHSLPQFGNPPPSREEREKSGAPAECGVYVPT